MSTYANLDSQEGSVSGTATVTLLRRSRRLILTNDSSVNNLQFKFNSSETFATLKPTETISLEINVREVFLSGTAPYRIWNYG